MSDSCRNAWHLKSAMHWRWTEVGSIDAPHGPTRRMECAAAADLHTGDIVCNII